MVSIELVDNPQQAHQLSRLFAAVWGDKNSISVDVIVAVVHAGGYASLALREDKSQHEVVGGSMALVGRSNDKLHSHVTGVVDGAVNSGVGRALKQHQWSWAKRNGFSAISWTFDPLVRRNAHFNLVTLGAKVVGYLPRLLWSNLMISSTLATTPIDLLSSAKLLAVTLRQLR
ncbi:MAG TPA: hypothetical protein DD711_06885 [Acidimicrobium sp.]|nr:hypothetical protein [Acidimicrobium sp.]